MANKTVLDFPDAGGLQKDDKAYLIRGTGLDRDKQVKLNPIIWEKVEVDSTGLSLDLSTVETNLHITLKSTTATRATLTLSDNLPAGLVVKVQSEITANPVPLVQTGTSTYSIFEDGGLIITGRNAQPSTYSYIGGKAGLVASKEFTNFNDVTIPGFHYLPDSASNAPAGFAEPKTPTYWICEYLPKDTGGLQRAVGFNGEDSIEYYREFDGTFSFTDWKHSGYSDGGSLAAGSLDDLSDGYYTSVGGVSGLPAGNWIVIQNSARSAAGEDGVNGASYRFQTAIKALTSEIYVRSGRKIVGGGTWAFSAWQNQADSKDLGEITSNTVLQDYDTYPDGISRAWTTTLLAAAPFRWGTAQTGTIWTQKNGLKSTIQTWTNAAQTNSWQRVALQPGTPTADTWSEWVKITNEYRRYETGYLPDANAVKEGYAVSYGTGKNLPGTTVPYMIEAVLSPYNGTDTFILQRASEMTAPEYIWCRRSYDNGVTWSSWVLNSPAAGGGSSTQSTSVMLYRKNDSSYPGGAIYVGAGPNASTSVPAPNNPAGRPIARAVPSGATYNFSFISRTTAGSKPLTSVVLQFAGPTGAPLGSSTIASYQMIGQDTIPHGTGNLSGTLGFALPAGSTVRVQHYTIDSTTWTNDYEFAGTLDLSWTA